MNGNLKLQNVSFKYDGYSQNVLSNINLEIKDGKTLGIIGPTGSGKSTLANLLIRSYDIKEGQIEISGHNLQEIKHSSLRANVAIAFQKAELISGSIKDNISFISYFDQMREHDPERLNAEV